MSPETVAALARERQAIIAEILSREARLMEAGRMDGANALAGLRGSLARLWALQAEAADRG